MVWVVDDLWAPHIDERVHDVDRCSVLIVREDEQDVMADVVQSPTILNEARKDHDLA